MFNLFKISVNAFRESLREPVYFLMLLSALVLIGHYPSAAIFVFSEQMKLVVDSSMATGLIFSLVVAVLCASYTIAREMRNGTVLLLLSKPVQRWSFIAGKIAGIVTAASLFAALCNCACVVAVYIATDQFRFDMTLYFSFLGCLAVSCVIGMVANFWRGASFPEVASLAASVLVPVFAAVCIATQPHPALGMRDLVKALLLINFAVLAMSTLAVVAATRFDVVPNLCFCTVMFFLGLVSSYLFQRETDSAALNAIFGFFYAIIPNWQFFWLADAVAVNRHIPTAYIVDAAFYVLLYIVIAAMWAVAIFQNREVAGSSR
ncbi:MAG: ABC transporter permease [Lentisphaeria bacterium]|nr:ABC transporter permease [Lentisphaeria bacterium]